MSKKDFLKIISLIMNMFIFSSIVACSKKEIHTLPASIKLNNGFVTFTLKDKNYQRVEFGSDVNGNWFVTDMENFDSLWAISMPNPHKIVQYKFLVNDKEWFVDPLNPNKIKVPAQFEGYNSITDFR